MKVPANLKHKPVIVAEDYAKIDGKYSTGKSDVAGLSVGLAQWNDRGNVDISAKVWRHTGEKWSRQSEELPLHRIIDLAVLLCKTKKYFAQAYRNEKLYDEKHPVIDKLEFQGSSAKVEVCTDNAMLETDIGLLYDALSRDDEFLSERLHVLADLLHEMGYGKQK